MEEHWTTSVTRTQASVLADLGCKDEDVTGTSVHLIFLIEIYLILCRFVIVLTVVLDISDP